MAINWQGKTNQQLYQARLAIGLLAEQKAASAPQALLIASYQSCLLQLNVSYQNYLHELAEMVHVSSNFHDLNDLLEQSKVPLGELKELQQLEADSFSWLAWLKSEFKICFQLQPSKEHAGLSSNAYTGISANMIAVAATESKGDLVAQLEQVYQSLKNIIDQQRVNQAES